MSADTDPRDTPLHPRRRAMLLGHEEEERKLLQAFGSRRLHHAWLIAGPRGIGKATLAYRFARFLLKHPDAGEAWSLQRRSRRSRLPSRRGGKPSGPLRHRTRLRPQIRQGKDRDRRRRGAGRDEVLRPDGRGGGLAGLHRRPCRRSQRRGGQCASEDHRGAAGPVDLPDRRPFAGTSPADHPVALGPPQSRAARRTARDRGGAQRIGARGAAGRRPRTRRKPVAGQPGAGARPAAVGRCEGVRHVPAPGERAAGARPPAGVELRRPAAGAHGGGGVRHVSASCSRTGSRTRHAGTVRQDAMPRTCGRRPIPSSGIPFALQMP